MYYVCICPASFSYIAQLRCYGRGERCKQTSFSWNKVLLRNEFFCVSIVTRGPCFQSLNEIWAARQPVRSSATDCMTVSRAEICFAFKITERKKTWPLSEFEFCLVRRCWCGSAACKCSYAVRDVCPAFFFFFFFGSVKGFKLKAVTVTETSAPRQAPRDVSRTACSHVFYALLNNLHGLLKMLRKYWEYFAASGSNTLHDSLLLSSRF